VKRDAGRTTASQQYNITAATNAPSCCRKIKYQAAVVNFPLHANAQGEGIPVQVKEEPLAFLFIAPRTPQHQRTADGGCGKNNNYPRSWVKIHNTLLILKLRLQ
jgi:hypothetical protein